MLETAASHLPRGAVFRSNLPGRLERLPWSAWHWRVVIAFGVTWVLDGLEVTLVGSVSTVLAEPGTLGLTETQIGAAASAYLAGAILGALVFGKLTDRLGRKRLFLVTLAVYLGATVLTALSWGPGSFAVFRALTGAGIGGEYAAVNSAIDELVPARVRGRVDLTINGTYWLGATLGAASTLILLDPHVLPHRIGWRVVFGLGATLGLVIVFVRRHVPESPRWLLSHGRVAEAEQTVASIEREVARHRRLVEPEAAATLTVRGNVNLTDVARVLLREHPRRTALGLSLMAAQAFAYNAIFFTYTLVLTRFYGVAPDRVGLFLVPFTVGNLLGPILLGRMFDTVGRRPMLTVTYATSGLLLGFTGYAFARGWLTAQTQTALWCLVFFVASAAASAAYLTVSELFPVEIRGAAIALFYSLGTALGGLVAPALFGALIESGQRWSVFWGYAIGSALMVGAAGTAAWLGVPAEGKSLEELCSSVEPAEA